MVKPNCYIPALPLIGIALFFISGCAIETGEHTDPASTGVCNGDWFLPTFITTLKPDQLDSVFVLKIKEGHTTDTLWSRLYPGITIKGGDLLTPDLLFYTGYDYAVKLIVNDSVHDNYFTNIRTQIRPVFNGCMLDSTFFERNGVAMATAHAIFRIE